MAAYSFEIKKINDHSGNKHYKKIENKKFEKLKNVGNKLPKMESYLNTNVVNEIKCTNFTTNNNMYFS